MCEYAIMESSFHLCFLSFISVSIVISAKVQSLLVYSITRKHYDIVLEHGVKFWLYVDNILFFLYFDLVLFVSHCLNDTMTSFY